MSPVPVVEFLEGVHRRHSALVHLAGDRTRIEVDRSASRVPDEVLKAIMDRSQEILAHLLASPGLHIAGYPPELMLAGHRFQELRIAERRKRHKIVEVVANGQMVTKWFDDVPSSRMREIARELEEWIHIRRRELSLLARTARASRAGSPPASGPIA